MIRLKENNKLNNYYDIFMGILALLVVLLLLGELLFTLPTEVLGMIQSIDKAIWIIFCIDYFGRLITSKNKWIFLKENIIDLLSIIPFNSMFQALRIVKIAKLTKILKLSKISKGFKIIVLLNKFKLRFDKFFKTNNFNYVTYLTVFIVIIGAVAISIAEQMTFDNALWWSFVTTTTVGYGDISPVTNGGRIIAVVLMLVGIGFIGMLTGTIATFFLGVKSTEKISYKQSVIEDVKVKLDDFDSLSKEELQHMFKVLKALK